MAAGTNDVAGDLIDFKMKIDKYDVAFNATGMAALRLDENGSVQALAACGLRYFKTQDFVIQLEERIDLALWKNGDGEFEGVIQSLKGDIPLQLLAITKDLVSLLPLSFYLNIR